MIDAAAFLAELHGEPPRAGNTAGFALLMETPAEVDAAAGRVAAAGHAVITEPYDAPWGQRYATVADPEPRWQIPTGTGRTSSACCPPDSLDTAAEFSVAGARRSGGRAGGPGR